MYILRAKFSEDQIGKVVKESNKQAQEQELPEIEYEVVTDSHIAPCSSCGNSIFIKTGVCHVCQVCGESQGCS